MSNRGLPARRAVTALSILAIGLLLPGCGIRPRPACVTPAVSGEQGLQALTAAPVDPEQVRARWEAGPHARSHLSDGVRQDASCVRCHAPENWMPVEAGENPPNRSGQGTSLASVMASPEPDWSPVGCLVCHPDGADADSGEIAWLDLPATSGYVPLETVSELCEECHLAADVQGHLSIVVSGSHSEMQCTDCHDPHDLTANCSAPGCHQPFGEECQPVETHDKPHQEASCFACHDTDGLKIGWNAAKQAWDTVRPPSQAGAAERPYSSHALGLEVACERCHEPGNHPWGETKP